MKSILFRTTSVFVLLLVVSLVPVYAHHGTEFLNKAMESNVTEWKLGQLAQTKSQDQRVKDFAAMIVGDHEMALDKMQMLLDERNKSTTAKGTKNNITDWHQMKLNPTGQEMYDKLAKLSGPEFDRQFMAAMITQHQKAIRDFETHARSHGIQDSTRQKPSDASKPDYAIDSDTVAFAQATLPTMKHHLQEAEKIQKEMKSGTPVSRQ
jgi:putative membrane protein